MATETKVKSWTHTTTPYPTTLALTNTPIPPQPLPHHILIKIHAASINPVDIQLMNLPLFNLPYLSGTKLLARDFSGEVLATSPEITDFQKGDEVFGIIPDFSGNTGCLTEVSHFDLRKACMIKKPGHLSHAQAASLPLVFLTARTSIDRVSDVMTKTPASENRLVVLGGSSSTGIYTIKLAKQRGWTVLASCSHRNAEFVRSLGADEIVDYTSGPSAVVDAVRAFGPDAIIDNVGGVETIGMAKSYVTIVGDKTSRSSMGGSAIYLTHPRMVMRYFLGQWGFVPKYQCIILEAKKEWLEEVSTLKDEDVIIDSRFPFEKTPEAFERMNTGRCRGKVVIELEQ
ncbi:hypothetical protein PMZ80_003929 [Knufia obscura]|uniref:Enoyl reductase (ER) domain-containing protein n=2 Tax=Knufia TaxID=430999 RepID=A0AAN8ECU9_9EURO|nr:hypothetical protein PMZ80_003929 [Knufia obscura]KAK5952338.1 hypothetical protein OHC33_006811 [Knufia fluminis]